MIQKSRAIILFLCILLASSCNGQDATQVTNHIAPNNGGSGFTPNLTSPSSKKHALIVAIGHYEPSTNWWDISSENDIPLITNALVRHGFPKENIHVVRGPQATRAEILEGVQKYLLGPSVQKGDVVVFHYSGHGQQITDDDRNEEPDGYDEALVPYDAPLCPSMRKKDGVCVSDGKYNGEKHLRDDDMHDLLQQLRKRVGPEGNVVVWLDSCFSGSATRGEHTAKSRGTRFPIGYPAKSGSRGSVTKEAGGFYENPTATSRIGGEPDESLSPYIVFSAARYDEEALETTTADGTNVGSLSYGLHHALSEARQSSSYRALFGEIVSTLKGRVDNRPQVEGHVDRTLFSGQAVDQRPLIVVQVKDSEVVLQAGSLAGLFKGTQVAFHQGRPDIPTKETLIGEGEVDTSEPLKAYVELSDETSLQSLANSSAFVTAYAFGDLHLGIHLQDFVSTEVKRRIENTLNEKGVPVILGVSEEAADVRIWERPSQQPNEPSYVMVEDAKLGLPILKPLPVTTPKLTEIIRRKLENMAYGRYLKNLDIKQTDFPATMEMVPVVLKEACRDSREPNPDTCVERELPLDPFLTPGHNLELPLGTWFQLKVHLPDKAAHVTVLDIWSDGTIELLWPPRGTRDKTKFPAGHKKVLPALYQIGEPLGAENFLLVATEEELDLEPFATPKELRARGSNENLGPFAPLFRLRGESKELQARGTRIFLSPGKVTTDSLSFTVTPGK